MAVLGRLGRFSRVEEGAVKQLSPERVRQLCTYDAGTGAIGYIGSKRMIKRRRANSYRWIMLDGVGYGEHRIAWVLHFGSWPTVQIDHINRDKSDNRIANLRDVSPQLNSQNRHAHMPNKTGFAGVQFDRRRSHYLTRLRVDGRSYVNRGFKTAEEAHDAYVRLKAKHHPGYVHQESPMT